MSQRPRFAAVVSLHETQEREARRRLGDLERRRQDLTDRISNLLEERHRSATAVGLGGRDQLSRYWIVVEGQVRQLQDGLARLEHEITAARTLLAEAHRNLAVFSKLQERDALVQRQAAERRAQRRLEEYAARRFHERQTQETQVEEGRR